MVYDGTDWNIVGEINTEVAVVNNLSSTNSEAALSAAQGKVLKDEIDDINSYIGDLLLVDVITIPSRTYASGAGAQVYVDVTKTGYTPIGIIGVRPSRMLTICNFFISGNLAYVGAYNYTSELTMTIDVYVLYKKN